MTIEIADRLVKLRKKYGYSQEELADKLGLSRQAVSKWERAEASPDTDNLICLAKLYGVSLDELLATDEDIDTIVKEQVKEEKKDDEPNEESSKSSEKKQDRVVINDDGIFLSDKNGERVTINDDGVTCYDKNGNVVKKVGKYSEHKRAMAVIGAIEGVLFLLAAAGFILLGALLNIWHAAWIVFFIPEMICSTLRCIVQKNPNHFNSPFFCCFVFFFVCMFLPALIEGMPQLWHPMWVVFLFVPIYHSICSAFFTAFSKNWHPDDDEKEDKGDIDLTKDDDDDEDDED